MSREYKRLFEAMSHVTALAILPVLTYRLWSNLRFLHWANRPMPSRPSTPKPRVSVLIPARNEAASIARCVNSLLHQDYANREIIVLDDQSIDGTGEKLDVMARRYPQLKVIHNADNLPAGWNGKSYACQRLAEYATGDWLLFTDADTEHMPECIARGIDRASMLNVDLLSVSPYQRTESWSERLVVSFIVGFLPLIGLDFRAIWRGE